MFLRKWYIYFVIRVLDSMSVKYISFILKFFNFFTPKKKQIIFHSVPDFSGNSLALYNRIKFDKHLSSYEMVWLVDNAESMVYAKFYNIDVVYKKRSIKGLLAFFRSTIIFSTHNILTSYKVKRQFHIELWHGTPLKRMGYMDNNIDLDSNYHCFDSLLSPSSLTDSLLAACFQINGDKLFRSNYPRNDFLYTDRITAEKKLSNLISSDISYERLFVYMPTFREGYLSRTDGRKLDTSNPFSLQGFDWMDFNSKLIELNTLLIVKLHPFEEKIFSEGMQDLSNVININQKMLMENGIEFYELLSIADALYTDYSSVYFDFILLNRPVSFICTDRDEYSTNRGFLLEPLDFWLPGPIIDTLDKFYASMNPHNDEYSERRALLNQIVNCDIEVKNISELLIERLVKHHEWN